MSRDPLTALVESLELTALDDDRFEGVCVERARPRMYGGELLAQTIAAAGRTVKNRSCHALHVHFLRAGDPALPIEYRVRRMRDGRRFALRSVEARQHGREILSGTVSFVVEGADAPGYQHERMPTVDGPEGLRTELDHRHDVADRLPPADRAWLLTPSAIEIRQVHPVPLVDPPPVPPIAHTWLRAIGRLPDDRTLHCAVLAYASDATLLDIACYPHGVSWIDPRIEQASLDHAMWFHRPFRADDWLLYAQSVPSVAAGRAFARGSIFTRAGSLVATVTQEGLADWRGTAPP